MRESLKELIKELDNLSSSRESLSRKDLPKEEKIELEERLKEERLELETKILKAYKKALIGCNILAKEYDKLKDPSLSDEEREQMEEEFYRLYSSLREIDQNRPWSKLSLKQKQMLHGVVLTTYRTINHILGFKCVLIKDERSGLVQPSNFLDSMKQKITQIQPHESVRPIIYVPTHVGKYDIQVISEALKDHYRLLSGDYEHLQGSVDSAFLFFNGVDYFYEYRKDERAHVQDAIDANLQAGGREMWFIEGTWNMTPNLPVLPCYWSIIGKAKENNALILPIGLDQYGKTFKVNIGDYFDVNNYDDTKEEKARAIDDLRSELGRLKWEIWETEPLDRSTVVGDEWDKYKQQRYAEWPGFSDEHIANLVFKPKNQSPSPDEVYAPVKKLTPNLNNAFLFNKRYSGYTDNDK